MDSKYYNIRLINKNIMHSLLTVAGVIPDAEAHDCYKADEEQGDENCETNLKTVSFLPLSSFWGKESLLLLWILVSHDYFYLFLKQ